MDLADIYGWSEATVLRTAIDENFREQVEARKNFGPSPSYIS